MRYSVSYSESRERMNYDPKNNVQPIDYETFFWTVIRSPQWEAWEKEVARRLAAHNKKHSQRYTGAWDIAECKETGRISYAHFQDFLKFVAK